MKHPFTIEIWGEGDKLVRILAEEHLTDALAAFNTAVEQWPESWMPSKS
jgi:hypothetical protein